ncbi:MAG: NPCBM/NEW2 domain-containing protein [Planctomycetaceae bacterium]|nr:NPCBM/NEW2 domain-containing protein [Planctomycetaceae bacterium]
MNAKQKYQLNELLYLSVEGMASPEQIESLNALLESDPEALGHSFDFYLMLSELRKTNAIADAFLGTKNEKCEQLDLLERLAMEEKLAPSIEIAAKTEIASPAPIVPNAGTEQKTHAFNKVSIAIGLMSLAALLLMVVYVHFVPSRQSVAQLVKVMNVQSGKGFRTLEPGALFYNTDEPIQLQKGYLEIAFDYGAVVVLEGPCEFACKSSGGLQLNYGKAFATVPPEASGFTIETPISRVVDLGTEFGVHVEADGSSRVNVFKGQTRLVSTLQKTDKISEMLSADQSRKVDGVSGAIVNAAFEKEGFARYFDPEQQVVLRSSIINLAAVVGGGNGIDAISCGSGIDQATGQQKEFEEFSGQLDGTRAYALASNNPFVDGVFVPDGGEGPVIVSSRGHVFQQCPDTNGRYWGGVINGASHEAQLLGIPKHNLRLGSIAYGAGGTSSIYMHANQGVTFDLEAIRQAYPGLSLDRFTAVCGISESLNDYADRLRVWAGQWTKLEPDSSKADFFVLVDGRVQHEQRDLTVRTGATEISIEIHPQDRFLTLVTTQGSDPWGNTNDWTLFGAPYLHVSPMK